MAILSFMLLPVDFGQLPDVQHSHRIQSSVNYIDGAFRYSSPTTQENIVSKFEAPISLDEKIDNKNIRPKKSLPLIHTNLKDVNPYQNLIVWLGHSSFYFQLAGKRILVDPVFSNHLSPVSFFYRDFNKNYPYTAKDFPDIDYLIISHDHWDHLDYPTVMSLKNSVKKVVVPLGVGSHFRKWGYSAENIVEGDWNDVLRFEDDFQIHILPARHFSGRGLKQNQTLWASFLFEGNGKKVYYSGDSGYGPHFSAIGHRFGKIDLAVMENGQYDKKWSGIHMTPEESVRAATELNANKVIPVHSGRFALANHAWNEPFRRFAQASKQKNFKLLTPVMGQIIDFDQENIETTKWWDNLL